MGRSLVLAIHLFLAGRNGPGEQPARPVRNPGRLVWFHCGSDTSLTSLGHLATLLKAQARDVSVLVTTDTHTGQRAAQLPKDVICDAMPPEHRGGAALFLENWRPDLMVLFGSGLPAVSLVEAHRRGVPVLLANARKPETGWIVRLFRRGMTKSLLGRLKGIMAQDAEAVRWYQALGRGLPPIDMTGRIEETAAPLTCSEAERSALAEVLGTRPIWLAIACPEVEEDAVLAAHQGAMRFAHRLLLILAPANPARGDALAAKIAAKGWNVSRRSLDEDPTPETQVFLADGEAEAGLWYRLAPVCYVGGTLTGAGGCPNPFEAAALGSAIIHGPDSGAYPRAFARLKAANATRPISSPDELPEAVDALTAPDRAALLAHNAWATSSGGAEVAARVVDRILAEINPVKGSTV
jgi:3-deoxy-D-manno-octulosonic-acid transferase